MFNRLVICPLSEAPPWGIVRVSWPHSEAFATILKSKDKCPGVGMGALGINRAIKYNWIKARYSTFRFVSGVNIGVDKTLSPMAMPCWWGLSRRKQLSTAASLRIIGRAHEYRFWPNRTRVPSGRETSELESSDWKSENIWLPVQLRMRSFQWHDQRTTN